MGTRFELVLVGDDAERHRPAGEAALELILEAHRRFTRFEPSGIGAHLARRAGAPVAVDPDTFGLFADAGLVWRRSEGAFDLTGAARAMNTLHLDPAARTVTLTRADVELDFGAIAKGHALDLAAALLRNAGVESAFLHGGTSSAIGIGTPPGEPGWRVALGSESGASTTLLRDQALSVSATWAGNPHPTVDPRTGESLKGPRRVAVVGPSARLADAWSTAILVSGQRPTLGPDWSIWIAEIS
ncbi:MAG: FAD:protein FMN transferase [Gemmatimonadales bacterium]|nr:FAD:protein FMN transferase [Gemmatimonadales bacterium]